MIEKDPSKRPNSEQVLQEVTAQYNLMKNQSTSIFSVYRALLTYKSLCEKIPKHIIPNNKQDVAKKPITYSFDLALKNMINPTTQGYPVIFQIRDILTYNNSKFI